MSDSSGYKATVTILFIVIGLPPGLCSMFGMTTTLQLLSNHSRDASGYAVLFGVPSLVGLVIFGLMLWWLIRTWRRPAP
jgi:hypothetical protein